MSDYKCKWNFISKDGRCLLPANRIQTSNPKELRERSPYVFEIVELGLHRIGNDYIPKCREIPRCLGREENGKKE